MWRLQGSRIVALDNLNLTGPGITLKVRSGFADNRLARVTVDALQLGRTDLHGSFMLPAGSGDPYVIDIAGRALDLSAVFGHDRKAEPSVEPANQALSTISSRQEFAPHPPWRATVNIDRIMFGTMPSGAMRELDGVRASVVNNGVVVRARDRCADGRALPRSDPAHDRAGDPAPRGTVTLTSERFRRASEGDQCLRRRQGRGARDLGDLSRSPCPTIR